MRGIGTSNGVQDLGRAYAGNRHDRIRQHKQSRYIPGERAGQHCRCSAGYARAGLIRASHRGEFHRRQRGPNPERAAGLCVHHGGDDSRGAAACGGQGTNALFGDAVRDSAGIALLVSAGGDDRDTSSSTRRPGRRSNGAAHQSSSRRPSGQRVQSAGSAADSYALTEAMMRIESREARRGARLLPEELLPDAESGRRDCVVSAGAAHDGP